MKLRALLCAVSFCSASLAGAQTVAIRASNVVFTSAAGEAKQLTDSGRDRDPMLSPDGNFVAFVRATPERKVESGSGDDASELWIVSVSGGEAKRLLEPHASKEMRNVVALINHPHFSADGKRLFFQTTAWTTSGAIHVLDLATQREHFVCAGDGLQIVRAAGDYRDCLVVQQHRYFIGGGSYDWFWLFRPDGREIGPDR